MNPAAPISEAVQAAGLEAISGEAADRFAAYLELLLKWNSRLNLTAIRSPEEIVGRHFLESIECARAIPAAQALPQATVLDLGSGAGFPGVPVAILRSDLEVTLAESQAKKSSFLREVIRTLGLSARIHDGRIEAMPASRQFGVVTLRAVDKMAEAAALAASRVEPGGSLLLFSTDNTRQTLHDAVAPLLPGLLWVEERPLRSTGHGFLMRGELPRQ